MVASTAKTHSRKASSSLSGGEKSFTKPFTKKAPFNASKSNGQYSKGFKSSGSGSSFKSKSGSTDRKPFQKTGLSFKSKSGSTDRKPFQKKMVKDEKMNDGNVGNQKVLHIQPEGGKEAEEAAQGHQMQKLLRLQRRAAKTPVFELIQELKKLWEQLRLKSSPKKDRQMIVAQTMKMIKGHIQDVIFKHDASRIIQALLKYSDPKDSEFGRSVVFAELAGKFVELAKSPYGRFVVLKALKYAPDAKYRSVVITEFLQHQQQETTHVVKLVKHNHAGLVIDTIFCLYANGKERQAMIEQFYGTEFQILKKTISNSPADDKKSALEKALSVDAGARTRIIDQLRQNLRSIVQTKMEVVGTHELLHRVLFEFFSVLNREEMTKMISGETADFFPLLAQIPTFIHTKFGSKLAQMLISASIAKERKGILKSMKQHARSVAMNEYGWQVICRIYTCVDDTVLVKNCISSELFGKQNDDPISNKEFADLLKSKHGYKVLLFLLTGQDKKYFSPDLIATLSTGEDYVAITSKKPAEQRRSENLNFICPRVFNCLSSDSSDNNLLSYCFSNGQNVADKNAAVTGGSQVASLLVEFVKYLSANDDIYHDSTIALCHKMENVLMSDVNISLLSSRSCCKTVLKSECMTTVANKVVLHHLCKLSNSGDIASCGQEFFFLIANLIERSALEESTVLKLKEMVQKLDLSGKGVDMMKEKLKNC